MILAKLITSDTYCVPGVTCVCGELATLPPAAPNPVFVGHGSRAASGAISIPLLVASMHVAAEEKVSSLLLQLS